MVSVAREGPNDRRGVDGRASLLSDSACGLVFSPGHTSAWASHRCFIKDGPTASNTGLDPERNTL